MGEFTKDLPDFSRVDGSGFGGARFVVLGVGNPIMGDDGIGLEIFSRLQAMIDSRPAWTTALAGGELKFVEGGTGGMELVPVVQESEHLLILDSVAGGAGRRAGDAVHLSGDHVPRLLSMKMSPHQVGLLDILTSARLTGREPAVLEVVGVVGEDVDLRLGLTAAAAGGIPRAVEMAAEILDRWLV
ncbi:MAG: hydrogenase maturation protease [Mobiluncus porci]|uniref:hydrogenase maturation protease n=1 Tax=Mobiluncus TaxID=2050 RepID=UPI0023F108F1|nr:MULTISPECIES: hydrogenase maturation protease [Mobiluncus]MCI6584196.1 hydrogenase maturation protease [Mobiluncus sp.]MDD7541890.1 hydrogenase maturation protease [Mobiluncus porci]MDY5749360.1 hydrogenase maturation protease [Mobiluncus porci]